MRRTQKKPKSAPRPSVSVNGPSGEVLTTLITRNLKHFHQIPGLRVENWAD